MKLIFNNFIFKRVERNNTQTPAGIKMVNALIHNFLQRLKLTINSNAKRLK
jgi:hypothetical protein